MRGIIIRFLQRIIDWILHVDNAAVLNNVREIGTTDINIAITMREIVDLLKIEGFDNEKGSVEYEGLRNSSTYRRFKEVAAGLVRFDPAELVSREEKLAFWINLYNSMIVDAVISLGVKDSIWEKGKGFFRKAAYNIGGFRYSADDIEHGILRENRRHPIILLPQFVPGDLRKKYMITPMEPRIHFALVCASRSCPIITVYHAPEIEEELEIAANSFINGGGAIVYPEENKVSLSRIFKWYAADFGGRVGVLEFILKYLIEGWEKEVLQRNIGSIRVEYQEYNWSLNKTEGINNE